MTSQDEAARWFAALRRGVMTIQEHEEYERWIAAKANRAALARMETVWSGVESANPRPVPHLGRKVMVAALCATLGMALLAFSSNSGPGNSGFWNSLDWANR